MEEEGEPLPLPPNNKNVEAKIRAIEAEHREIDAAIQKMTGAEYREYLEMCHQFGGYREDIDQIPDYTAEHENIKEEFLRTHKFKNWWGGWEAP